jgi:CubicO group peptidase (beta-lactamase class C family)
MVRSLQKKISDKKEHCMKLMPDTKRRSHSAIERKRVKFFVAFCFVVFMISSSIANADEKTDQIDRLFARWDSTISPGAALAVIQEGQIIYKRGYGMANLEHNIPITPTSVFRIGSVSKQFTAACIVILAIKGNLGLDDDIRKYIPEIPRYDRTISIKASDSPRQRDS